MINDSVPPRSVHLCKVIARITLGLVWLYEGVIPKNLFLHAHPEQIELVRRSGLFWTTPELTLVFLGWAQALFAVVLIIGWAERWMVVAATVGMAVLIYFVATGMPAMLTDPFGALIKDLCLVSAAATVWLLSGDSARVTKDCGKAAS